MLRSTAIALLCFYLLSTAPAVGQSADAAKFKVITYNIWNGFDWGKDTTRRANWTAWIKNQDPDVLALQELCGYTEARLKAEAAQWGHPYAVILKEKGYPVGITSKKPITVKERAIQGFWHGMLHVETYGIDFFVVHLSPSDCDFRLREAKIISQKVEESATDKYIILGDFNAFSPFDEAVLRENVSLLKKYAAEKSEKNYSNLRLGEFDYSVVANLLGIPTVDVCLDYVPTDQRFSFPTPAIIGIWTTEAENRQHRERIDYILASPRLGKQRKNAMIFNGTETAALSDHFPVMAEFTLENN